jgi:hypothetical protein
VSEHLLDYVPEFSSMARQKRVSGPCPWCGGDDRFVVFVEQGDEGTGSYYCFDNPGRGCGRGGDAIDFLETYHEMDWAEACEALGLEEKLEEYSGKPSGTSEEDRRIENEKRASDAALRVKTWNLVRQRLAAIEEERKRRKQVLRRKKRRERRREVIENMNAGERWLLSETKVYRRTRRLHRAVARFVTLHARSSNCEERCPGGAGCEKRGSDEEKYERIGSAARPTESPMEILNQPARFEHCEELYRAFRQGLQTGLQRAPGLDETETKNRKDKLIRLAAKAQKSRSDTGQDGA